MGARTRALPVLIVLTAFACGSKDRVFDATNDPNAGADGVTQPGIVIGTVDETFGDPGEVLAECTLRRS